MPADIFDCRVAALRYTVRMLKLALAADHAGYPLKESLKAHLLAQGYAVEDLGTHSEASVDYPDYANALAAWMQDDARGILICGSGIGISIAANRHKHLRAALCHNLETATLARQHNDANVLCLGARFVDKNSAKQMVDMFLATGFDGGRHQGRVEKLLCK